MTNKTLKSALAVLAVCLFPLCAQAETRTMSLVATDDVSATSIAATETNGTASSLLLEYATASELQSITYLAFDLTKLPKDVVVTKAELTLFASSVVTSSPVKVQLRKVQDSWAQSTLTWDTKPDPNDGGLLANATLAATSTGEFITWPDEPTMQGTSSDQLTVLLNSYVRASIPQFSFVLLGPAKSPDYRMEFVSREGTGPENSTPRLVVTYDQPGPKISGVTVTDIADTKATISWVTDKLADSTVLYGTSTASLDQEFTLNSTTTNHTITLQGLKPRTEYAYRVRSEDGEGFASSSDLQPSFTTLAAPLPTNDDQDEATEPQTEVAEPEPAAQAVPDQTKQQPAAQKTATKPLSTPATTAPATQSGDLSLDGTTTDTSPKKSPIDLAQQWAVKFLPFAAIIGFFIIIFRSSISGYAEAQTPGMQAPRTQAPAPLPPRPATPPAPVYPPRMPANPIPPSPPAPEAWYDAPAPPRQPPPLRPRTVQMPRPPVVRLTTPPVKNRPPVLDLKKK